MSIAIFDLFSKNEKICLSLDKTTIGPKFAKIKHRLAQEEECADRCFTFTVCFLRGDKGNFYLA